MRLLTIAYIFYVKNISVTQTCIEIYLFDYATQKLFIYKSKHIESYVQNKARQLCNLWIKRTIDRKK